MNNNIIYPHTIFSAKEIINEAVNFIDNATEAEEERIDEILSKLVEISEDLDELFEIMHE